MSAVLYTGVVLEEEIHGSLAMGTNYMIKSLKGLDLSTLSMVDVKLSQIKSNEIMNPLKILKSKKPCVMRMPAMRDANSEDKVYRAMLGDGYAILSEPDGIHCGFQSPSNSFCQIFDSTGRLINLSTDNSFKIEVNNGVYAIFTLNPISVKFTAHDNRNIKSLSLADNFKTNWYMENWFQYIDSGIYAYSDTVLVDMGIDNTVFTVPKESKRLHILHSVSDVDTIVFNQDIEFIESLSKLDIKSIAVSSSATLKQQAVIANFLMQNREISDERFIQHFNYERYEECCNLLNNDKELYNRTYNGIEVVRY